LHDVPLIVRSLALSLLVACGSRDEAKRDDPPPLATPDASANLEAAPAPTRPGTPEELWQRYRAIHATATQANAIETGKQLWSMLTPDAQALVDQAGKATLAAARSTSVEMDLAELRFKLLGESAVARVEFMKTATISELEAKTSAATLTAKGAGQTLTFELVRATGGPWLFTASPGLLATDTEVFRLPSGQEETKGAPSVDASIQAWKRANATGTGWDAYNLLSPAMRSKILRLVSSVGGSGAADAARIFEKTLVDRRNRGVTITTTKITDQTADQATVEITYSSGKPETITLVKVDGVWWVEMPL
jgi:hypothetical protein